MPLGLLVIPLGLVVVFMMLCVISVLGLLGYLMDSQVDHEGRKDGPK